MKTRLAAVITGVGEVKVIEEKMPVLKHNMVLLKVHASLISPGTEILGGVVGRRKNPNPKDKDIVFGYANAGEIVQVKGKCPGLEKGMRVAAMGGGFAVHGNYACVPVNLVEPLPDNLNYEDATYACLAATALQSVRRTAPQLGEYGAVLGLGIVGNLAAQFYQLGGARVIGWEGFTNRIRIAKKCGVANIVNFKSKDPAEETKKFAAPYGLDFANIAFGGDATKAWQQVLGCMKKSPDTHQMGRVVVVGGAKLEFGGGAYSGNVDVMASSRTGPGYHDPVYEFGQDYPNAFVQFTTKRNLREIVTLLSEKRLHVKPMTTHTCALAKVGEMADRIINAPNDALGVVLKMPH
jgi:threonine dehydrogenase-like Zn-dependent dehydrogenase